MKTNRRKFISTAVAGGIAATTMPLSSCVSQPVALAPSPDVEANYAKIDEILKQPVLKKELFPNPVIIDTVELLRYETSFLIRVRSKDGAEGMSMGHGGLSQLTTIFLQRFQPYFIGQDARELDLILERIYIYSWNFRYSSLAVGIPMSAVEYAVLDMLGRMINKPVQDLIGTLTTPEIPIYIATEFRELPLEEHFAKIKESAAEFDTRALKFKVGYQWNATKDIHYGGVPGKTEKLIPMVREAYPNFNLYADSNGYYDVPNAIRVGKLLEEYKYIYFEEPVMFNHFTEIKKVADALTIPVANGEQDSCYENFKWLLANDGLDIVQPDTYYFGGMIRSMKVARMAHAFGKTIIPHTSGMGFLYGYILVSCVPNPGLNHEFRTLDPGVKFECPTSPLKVVEGKIKIPYGPGMGLNFDPDWVKKHTLVTT